MRVCTFLRTFGTVSFLIASLAIPIARAQTSFTFVALPDTQNYVKNASTAPLFTQQTQWIADQIQNQGNPRNIQFVSHLGDLVSNAGDMLQWQRADTSMDVLDEVVKYSVLPGNHDYLAGSVKSSGTDAYQSYFGPNRFSSYAWYGGADPSGNNSYQYFSAEGIDFLHLALEWEPINNTPARELSPVAWAQSVLDENPNLPVILSTHDYVQDNPGGRSLAGEALWDQLIRSNDQIFLVLNGHFHAFGFPFGGQHHQVSTNDAGRPVVEVLQNYQGFSSGGNGWLRLIEFDLANNQLAFETYSPSLTSYLSTEVEDFGTWAGQFELDINLAERLVPVETLPTVGDFDEDRDVDGDDFLFWQTGGSSSPFSLSDLETWQQAYTQEAGSISGATPVPEPSGSWLVLIASVIWHSASNRLTVGCGIRDS